MTNYSNGFAVAVRDKKLFMLDRDGKEYSLPPVFQKYEIDMIFPPRVMIYELGDGIFFVRFSKEGKIGYFKVGD